MKTNATARGTEIKTHTLDEIKADATMTYDPEAPSYDALAALAYKAPLNADGIAVVPAEWDDSDE